MLSENTDRRILLAPLDWGLGHTTRVVPIIRHLYSNGFTPVVACNRSQANFLSGLFPQLLTVHLEGYGMEYAKIDWLNNAAIMSQIPKVMHGIKRERAWVYGHLAEIKPLAIISDNRYGLHHPSIPSVIISHQPGLQTGMGEMIDAWVQRWHYSFMEKFNELWIPDTQGTNAIAGKLSNPAVMPELDCKYIGPLSQFVGLSIAKPTEQYLLVLLSGPEPQRTKLELQLLEQCAMLQKPTVMVGGTHQQGRNTRIASNITYINRTSGQELANLIMGASIVICRAGYSTIMDLVYLKKPAIMIPTPGQTEQEYLGIQLNGKMGLRAVKQHDLDVKRELLHVNFAADAHPDANYQAFQPVVAQFLNSL